MLPFLTDHQFSLLSSLFPPLPVKTPRGRPPLPDRLLLDALLWKLSLGFPWDLLPPGFPPAPSVYRRYRLWTHTGLLQNILYELIYDLYQRGAFDPRQAYAAGLVQFQGSGRFLQISFDPSLLVSWQDSLSPSPNASWQERTARLFYRVAILHRRLLLKS